MHPASLRPCVRNFKRKVQTLSVFQTRSPPHLPAALELNQVDQPVSASRPTLIAGLSPGEPPTVEPPRPPAAATAPCVPAARVRFFRPIPGQLGPGFPARPARFEGSDHGQHSSLREVCICLESWSFLMVMRFQSVESVFAAKSAIQPLVSPPFPQSPIENQKS